MRSPLEPSISSSFSYPTLYGPQRAKRTNELCLICNRLIGIGVKVCRTLALTSRWARLSFSLDALAAIATGFARLFNIRRKLRHPCSLRQLYLPEISVTPFAGFLEFGLLSADYADLRVRCDSKAKSIEHNFLPRRTRRTRRAIAINGFFVFFVSFVVKKFPFFLSLLCAGFLKGAISIFRIQFLVKSMPYLANSFVRNAL